MTLEFGAALERITVLEESLRGALQALDTIAAQVAALAESDVTVARQADLGNLKAQITLLLLGTAVEFLLPDLAASDRVRVALWSVASNARLIAKHPELKEFADLLVRADSR